MIPSVLRETWRLLAAAPHADRNFFAINGKYHGRRMTWRAPQSAIGSRISSKLDKENSLKSLKTAGIWAGRKWTLPFSQRFDWPWQADTEVSYPEPDQRFNASGGGGSLFYRLVETDVDCRPTLKLLQSHQHTSFLMPAGTCTATHQPSLYLFWSSFCQDATSKCQHNLLPSGKGSLDLISI